MTSTATNGQPPTSTADSDDQPASQTPRPAYSSRGTRPLPGKPTNLPQPTDDHQERGLMAIPERVFHSTSLRGRMMAHIVAVAGISLVLIGYLLATTGIIQVNNSERDTISAIHSDLQVYAQEVTQPDASGQLTDTSEILKGFLATKPPISGSSLLGFVDGTLQMHQATKDTPAHEDKALLTDIATHAGDKQATQFRVTTPTTTYTVGVIPLHVDNSNDGFLAVVMDHKANTAPTWNTMRMFAGTSLLGLVLILVITWRMSGRVFSPIARLEKMMRSIASGDDLSKRVPVQGDQRLQQVALSFNAMLDRLQDSFESQYNLLNDIGHEMRTPLTVIHGHVELMNPNNSAEVAHTRGLVLDEIDRMHRMTEDLVTVATMNRPDFLRCEPMLVPELTLDVYEHASQLSDNTWRVTHVADAEITADYQRLVQAFLQLCQNASKFTEPNTVIELGSHIDQVAQVVDNEGHVHKARTLTPPRDPSRALVDASHHVYLWVRDHGVGIEPIDQERIFERFARVDHSRPGSGLGLSIVDAIAQAHGGWLEVQSVPGIGSVFAIALPLDDSQDTHQQKEGE